MYLENTSYYTLFQENHGVHQYTENPWKETKCAHKTSLCTTSCRASVPWEDCPSSLGTVGAFYICRLTKGRLLDDDKQSIFHSPNPFVVQIVDCVGTVGQVS